MVKNPSANVGDSRDVGSIPGSERTPGVGNSKPLQCSRLENSMDKGIWRVAESDGLQSWVHEESDTTEQLAHIHAQSRMVSVPCEQIKESTIRGPWERVTILARGIRRVSEKM